MTHENVSQNFDFDFDFDFIVPTNRERTAKRTYMFTSRIEPR